jgi:Mrp family chromosome partitioning ATPase
MHSVRFKQLLGVLREYFDYVIVDTPPLGNVSDARILSPACDGVILVVRASSTSRHQAKQAVEHLMQPHTRIAGVVLNDLDLKRQGNSYYSSYYYANKAS